MNLGAREAVAPVAHVGASRRSAGWMTIVALAYLAVVLAAAIYPLVSPLRDWQGPAGWDGVRLHAQAIHALGGVLWLGPLLLAIAREPHGRLWKLILAWVVADRLYALSFVPDSMVWSITRPLGIISIPVFMHLVLAFPSGHLRDRFERRLVLFAYVFGLGSNVLAFLAMPVEFACEPDCIRNLFVLWPSWELAESITRLQVIVLTLLVVPLALVALWRHWRDATAAGRRVLLPVAVAVPILAAVVSLDNLARVLAWAPGVEFFASPAGEVVRLAVWLVLPVGLLAGILEARLARVRVAALVVELGRGIPVGSLREVLARALGDPTLELAFAAPSGTGFVDAAGRSVELPASAPGRTVTRLERAGELLGVLVHDPAIEAEDPSLLEAVGNAARLALENERLAAEVRAQLEEVRASRTRIVEAADAERRRIERDLHDGAQQRLLALAMRLQVAKGTTVGAATLLDEATAELEAAVGEVRGLARGVHPAILTEAGLRAAVEALAERTPLPLSIDVTDRRFPPPVEATAYFVVSEAIANVTRHAGASHARVTAEATTSTLVVSVTDDGTGGADPAAGTGLRGLADRVAAAGGALAVSSPSHGGTLVRAELPLEPDVPHEERAAAQGAAGAQGAAPIVAVRSGPGTVPPARRRVRTVATQPIGLIVGVVGFIGVLAGAAGLIGLQEREPENGRADAFARPFAYQVAGGSGIRLYPYSASLHVLKSSPNAQLGISIWSVQDVLADPCRPNGAVGAWARSADGLVDHLRTVPALLVHDAGTLSVGGRSARRLDLTVRDGESGCAEDALVLWRDPETGDGIWISERERVRVMLVEVDGAVVAFEIWSRADLDDWERTAEEIVRSVLFLNVEPIGAPG